MKSCEQSSGLTILEHGFAVSQAYKELFAFDCIPNDNDWYLPPEVWSCYKQLRALAPNPEVMETYHLFHDVGKPVCCTIDENGKKHFPNHAQISAREWLVSGGDHLIGRLIEHDMDMHTLKPAQVPDYKQMDLAPALLLTAWAELNANSKMFGGRDSVSFKIKSKALTKLSKAFISRIFI